MTFNDIKSKVYTLTKTNSASFPVADIAIAANTALDRVVSLIMQADGRWQFDDTNQTDLPIATADIVADQEDYSLAVSHIDITKVRALYPDGTWHTLDPIDQTDETDDDKYQDTGLPIAYDKLGNSVFPLPTPNYSLAAALEIHFKRPGSYFVVGDTTKAPGINPLYHDLIPLWIAYEHALANGRNTANGFLNSIQLKEAALQDDYANRSKQPIRMTAQVYSSR